MFSFYHYYFIERTFADFEDSTKSNWQLAFSGILRVIENAPLNKMMGGGKKRFKKSLSCLNDKVFP